MSAREKENKINLLPQKGFEKSTAGRVLTWILSTFRIIVIVTEIIVMVAFLSRFWLDAKNTDLRDEIEQKQAVLSATSSFDRDFKEAQTRLRIFSELTQGKFILKGKSPNVRSIDQLTVNLSASDTFNEAFVQEIATDEDNPTLFRFEVLATPAGREVLQ